MLLVFVLALSIAGCAKKEEAPAETTTETTKEESKETSDDTTETATEVAEDVTLDVWHLWTTENDGNAVSFAKALEEYRADHPNVTVNIDATENEAYKTKIKTAISANEAPDVFFLLGGVQVSHNHLLMQDK